MAETKPNRQIIIVDDFSDDEDATHNSNTQGHTPNHSTPHLPQQTQTTIIQIKSHRNLSPTQPTEIENDTICPSPTQFSKRHQHKIVVYSGTDEDDNEQQSNHPKMKSDTSSNRDTSENKDMQDTKIFQEQSEQINDQNNETLHRFEKGEYQRQHLYSRQKPRARKNVMVEEYDYRREEYNSRREEYNSRREEYEESEESGENQENEEKKEKEESQEYLSESDDEQEYEEKKERTSRVINQISPLRQALAVRFKGSQIVKLISHPLSQGYKLAFFIQIQPGFLGFATKYHLTLAPTNPTAATILSAKKEIVSLMPSYIVSTSRTNHSARNPAYVAHLKSTFSGSEWVLNVPKQANPQNIFSSKVEPRQGKLPENEQKLYIKYGESILGYKSLRAMEVFKIDPEYRKRSKYSLTQKVEHKKTLGLISLKSKYPTLVNGRYKVDFQGKAKMASNKNFILTSGEQKGQKQVLLLAKQNQSTFIMEVSYPLTVLQGFSLCLSSLDSKLLVN